MLIDPEYIKTFSLIDPPLLDRLNNRFGMQVRFFTKKEQDSPIVNLGDVVVLRRIRVCLFTDREDLLSLIAMSENERAW